MVEWVKDPALSLLWCRFDSWPRNFCMPQVWQKERKKEKRERGRKEGRKERKKKKGRKPMSISIISELVPVGLLGTQVFLYPAFLVFRE